MQYTVSIRYTTALKKPRKCKQNNIQNVPETGT